MKIKRKNLSGLLEHIRLKMLINFISKKEMSELYKKNKLFDQRRHRIILTYFKIDFKFDATYISSFDMYLSTSSIKEINDESTKTCINLYKVQNYIGIKNHNW